MPELKKFCLIAIIFVFRFCIYAHDDDFGGESVSFEPLFEDIKEPEGAYFSETFSSQENFNSKWILSKAKKEHTDESINKYDGEWKLEEPVEIVLKGDKGLVLKSKAKHHAISAKLNRPFVFDGKTFIVQFEVKLQRGLDCGGAYIKLLMEYENLDLLDFYDRTPYVIMFGPDKCGNDMKIHFIFRHKNPLTGKFEEKHSMKKPFNLERVFNNKMTHLYTLIIQPNNTFTIMIDMEVVSIGSLLYDMQPPVNPAKLIVDLNDTKPLDWDDKEMIPDVNAKKPDDWDETAPELVPDPYAKVPEGWLVDEEEWIADDRALKPNDWDDDIDGHWEPPLMINPNCEKALGCGEWKPPLVKNPKFKGKWQPPLIKNPAYKGAWSPRRIPNPNYFYDPQPYNMSAIGALGLELWSMAVDIMFDNFLITSSLEDARTWAEKTWRPKNDIEKTREDHSKVSTIDAIILAANEKPWLWIVIILVIVVPTLIFIMFCCAPPPSKTASGRLKKQDDDISDNGRGSFRDPRSRGQLRLRNQAFEHSDTAYKKRLPLQE